MEYWMPDQGQEQNAGKQGRFGNSAVLLLFLKMSWILNKGGWDLFFLTQQKDIISDSTAFLRREVS